MITIVPPTEGGGPTRVALACLALTHLHSMIRSQSSITRRCGTVGGPPSNKSNIWGYKGASYPMSYPVSYPLWPSHRVIFLVRFSQPSSYENLETLIFSQESDCTSITKAYWPLIVSYKVNRTYKTQSYDYTAILPIAHPVHPFSLLLHLQACYHPIDPIVRPKIACTRDQNDLG